MKKMRRWSVVALAAMLVVSLLSGCKSTSGGLTDTKQPADTKGTEATQPADTKGTEATQPVDDEAIASLVSLRQAMVETPQRFAVAYLGYGEQEPTDPFALMKEMAPQLCEDLPFLLHIPKENVIGTSGQLYCIVPLDENATVAVNAWNWNPDSGTYEDQKVLYRSEKGDPILLLCNNTGWEPDVQVAVTDYDGTVTTWWPSLDSSLRIAPMTDENGESVFMDFSCYDELPAPEPVGGSVADLAGTWELVWTEVEGDRVEVSSGRCTLEIAASMMVTYRDKDFPEDNFTNRELSVISGEIYPDCGNNQWIAYVSTENGDIITHCLTLLEDGTLLMQHSFTMDGMPMVSYGWFQRVS